MKNFKNKVVENWVNSNGACDFDLKSKKIILPDGGLFSIENKKVRTHKVKGFKKLPNGNMEIIFSKKKYHDLKSQAILFFGELDETINYFKRMKKMLNSLGYKTGRSKR